MAKVAIVSYDVQTIFGKAGGVGAFTTRWAEVLRQAGETVTIVTTRTDQQPMRLDLKWRARLQENRISVIELQAPPPIRSRYPESPTVRMAEIAAPVLRGFDAVYFQDWGNAGFHLLRERRYSLKPSPVCVTVLHGPSEWELKSTGKYPDLPKDFHLSFQERYSARHSDFVVSPSQYMVENLKGLDWEFPGPVEVLGLPMPEPSEAPQDRATSAIRKIVYFGRGEERKGIRNFVLGLKIFAKTASYKPDVVLLGSGGDQQLLASARRGIEEAGFAFSHQPALDSESACRFLRQEVCETLCVIPSFFDGHPYSLVEATLIPGLNVIACRGGGVPEALWEAEKQRCDAQPDDLAAKIAERVNAPLGWSELARYDWRAANEKWLSFHDKALACAPARSPRVARDRKASVDVCVTYYQKPAYLGQLIDALEQQTETDFHVIAVNDGSPDGESNRKFEEHATRAAKRGWDFYRQANAFVDAARNSAARRGSGDLILFVDADDVPAKNAVARMREAISLSGDDALICASYLFASENRPFDPATGEVREPAYATQIPFGMDLVGGLVNPFVFGGSMFIVRRSVFEKIGGFRELRGAGHEDWELYVRLALAGYRVEVLPELLHFYRQVEDGLARTLPAEPARRRLLDAYEDALNEAGLKGAAVALAGLYRNGQEMEKEMRRLRAQVTAPRKRFAVFSPYTNRFEPDGGIVERLRQTYRALLPLNLRLKFHRIFLAPIVGSYEPPHP
jgi:GT2 family glycosyltransferase